MAENTTLLYEQAKEQWETFEKNHTESTKSAATRARKASNELTKILKEYRKVSIEENK